MVIWAPSITSVIGCAYTSVTFLTNFSDFIERNKRFFVIGFITISTLIFMTIGKPAQVLGIGRYAQWLGIADCVGDYFACCLPQKYHWKLSSPCVDQSLDGL